MRESVIHRLLLPAAVGLIAVIFALNVMERLLTQQQAQVEAATKAQAVFVKNKIESVLAGPYFAIGTFGTAVGNPQ